MKGRYGMKEALDSRLKTALDESPLILGAQILLGFQFQAVFQERFNEVSGDSKLIHGAGLLLLLVTVGALIAQACCRSRLASALPRSSFSIICLAAHRGSRLDVALRVSRSRCFTVSDLR